MNVILPTMFSRSLREFEWTDLMDERVQPKLDRGRRPHCWHGDTSYRQAPDAPAGVLVTVAFGTTRHLQVNYSSDYHLLCLRWILWGFFFFLLTHCPHFLSSHSLTLSLVFSFFFFFSFLNKSVTSLNPVSTENCRHRVRCLVWRV